MRKVLLAGIAVLAFAMPAQAANLVGNGSFSKGLDPWWLSPTFDVAFGTGELCAAVPGGTAELWDVIVGQNDVVLEKGKSYTFSFKARASRPDAVVRALVQQPVKPWTPYIQSDEKVGTEQVVHSLIFTPGDSRKNAQVAFQVGGVKDKWLLCIDDVVVEKK
jgi:endoglucanase